MPHVTTGFPGNSLDIDDITDKLNVTDSNVSLNQSTMAGRYNVGTTATCSMEDVFGGIFRLKGGTQTISVKGGGTSYGVGTAFSGATLNGTGTHLVAMTQFTINKTNYTTGYISLISLNSGTFVFSIGIPTGQSETFWSTLEIDNNTLNRTSATHSSGGTVGSFDLHSWTWTGTGLGTFDTTTERYMRWQ